MSLNGWIESVFAGVKCCLYIFSDLDKMDSIKDEMNQADMAALHHFYSRYISDIPDDQALTELFAQVHNTMDRVLFT